MLFFVSSLGIFQSRLSFQANSSDYAIVSDFKSLARRQLHGLEQKSGHYMACRCTREVVREVQYHKAIDNRPATRSFLVSTARMGAGWNRTQSRTKP